MAKLNIEGSQAVDEMYFQATKLGFVASGSAQLAASSSTCALNMSNEATSKQSLSSETSLNKELKKLRDDENYEHQLALENLLTPKESKNVCDEEEKRLAYEIFKAKSYIKEDGTHVVPLCIKPGIVLGKSEKRCLARNCSLMEKLSPEKRAQVWKLIQENIDSGKWTEIVGNERGKGLCYNPLVLREREKIIPHAL